MSPHNLLFAITSRHVSHHPIPSKFKPPTPFYKQQTNYDQLSPFFHWMRERGDMAVGVQLFWCLLFAFALICSARNTMFLSGTHVSFTGACQVTLGIHAGNNQSSHSHETHCHAVGITAVRAGMNSRLRRFIVFHFDIWYCTCIYQLRIYILYVEEMERDDD